MFVSRGGGNAASLSAGTMFLAAVVGLAAVPACEPGNCAADCSNSFLLLFEAPISAEGTWTFEARFAEFERRCTVALPEAVVDCAHPGGGPPFLYVGTGEGDVRWLELHAFPDTSRSTELHLSIEQDGEPVVGLRLRPAFAASDTCGKTCYHAESSVWF